MFNKKFTASLIITALVLSSLQPVLAADSQETLDERGKLLTEKALMLSDKSVNLDDREAELNKRSAELEALSKEIHSRNIDFSVREIELDELRASLNRDTSFLASQAQDFMRDREQFTEYKAEVQKKADDAEKLAREAAQKLKDAEERSSRNSQREKELSQREQEIQDSLSQIEISRAEILAMKKKTQEDADNAKAKLAELEQEKLDLQEAQKIFAAQKENLNSEKLDLDSLKAQADKTMADAQAVRAEADAKIQKADEILKINQEQEQKIAELSKDLKTRENQLKALLSPEFSSNGELYASLLPGLGGNVSITSTTNGIMNWSDGSIRAKGLGVAPNTDNPAQARALARRAAIVDLQRNLLETVQGVKIDSQTKMENFMADDKVSSAVNGMIKGVEVIEENWDADEKSYTVMGQIRPEKMSGAMSEVRKHVKLVKKLPAEPKKKTGRFTGLILDVRHLPVEQQKFFHIVDEKGTLVYGSEYADKKILDQSGLCAYYEKIVLRDDEKIRVGDNPLVVKAQRFAGNGTDIVIPNEDAQKIRSNAVNFRKDCKVIIVRS